MLLFNDRLHTVHSHQLRDEAENGPAFNTSDACLVGEVQSQPNTICKYSQMSLG